MPKLDNGSFGTKFGYQIDKCNETVGFEDSTHTYFDLNSGDKYISTTQLLSKYKPEFNGDFWSSYKAMEALMDVYEWRSLKSILLKTKKFKDSYLDEYKIDRDLFNIKKQEILASYDKASKDACEKGTRKHLEKELSFYNEKTRNVSKYGIGGKFGCEKGKFKLNDYQALYPELLISYDFDGLKICGQADLVCKAGNDIYILDWKTSKKIEKTSYFDSNTKKNETLKFPLNHLMSSNYWIYSLQLSIYMFCLENQYPEFNCKKLMIVHIDDDDNETVYECPYLRDEVDKLIKHYKKHSKIHNELNRIKPIEIC